MQIETFTLDTFSLIVTWVTEDGNPKVLTGATAQAFAERAGTVKPLAASVIDGPSGQIRISAASGTFDNGHWQLQLRVTQGGVTRTFSTTIVARSSLAA